MSYINHLNKLKDLSSSEKKKLITNLCKSCPVEEWPRTMPASVDPKLILIGVSPGGSQNLEIDEGKFSSRPSIVKSESSNFFYPDKNSYWKKVRFLAHHYFKSFEKIDLIEALSLTSHFNLGIKATGKATKKAVDDRFIKWVSKLLNVVHKPDLVVLFGLKEILQDSDKSMIWNHENGLKINWNNPSNLYPFTDYEPISYKFREWNVTNAQEHNFKVLLWPNHPSRPPFSKNFDMWKKSVAQYLSEYKNT